MNYENVKTETIKRVIGKIRWAGSDRECMEENDMRQRLVTDMEAEILKRANYGCYNCHDEKVKTYKDGLCKNCWEARLKIYR